MFLDSVSYGFVESRHLHYSILSRLCISSNYIRARS